jgi:hypothetical protein
MPTENIGHQATVPRVKVLHHHERRREAVWQGSQYTA